MGKSRPPNFKECPICHREFGSKSLQFHLIKCQDRNEMVTNNNNSKHDSTSSEHDDSYYDIETSLSEELSNSWPKRRNNNNKDENRRNRRKTSRNRKIDRPTTAVLKRPIILDETLKDKVDMTMTKKQFLAAFKLCSDEAKSKANSRLTNRGLPIMRNRRAAVGYKKDVMKNNSVNRVYGGHREGSLTRIPHHVGHRPSRPKTTRLQRPTNDMVDLPKIQLPNPALKVKSRPKTRSK